MSEGLKSRQGKALTASRLRLRQVNSLARQSLHPLREDEGLRACGTTYKGWCFSEGFICAVEQGGLKRAKISILFKKDVLCALYG